MNHRLSLLLVVITLLAFTIGATPRPAAAAVSSVTSDCTSVTVTGNTSGTVVLNAQVTLSAPLFTFLGGNVILAPLPGPYTLSIAIPQQPPGTGLMVNVLDPFLTTVNITCGTPSAVPGAVTVFNPGDGRVDPQAGDRLAIWCNTSGNTPNLLIYGVASDSKGLFLATINFADLLKAGNPRLRDLNARLRKLLNARGNSDDTTLGTEINKLLKEIERESLNISLTKNLGKNGTLSISVDADNNFWVSWTGGPYGANGQGVWAKSFKCDFKR